MNPDSNLTALARNNRTCMIAHTATAGVMLLLLFLQAATRGINPAVLTISCILGIAPVAAELLYWKKNHETTAIRHLVGNGFAVFFTFYIYTSTTFMAIRNTDDCCDIAVQQQKILTSRKYRRCD